MAFAKLFEIEGFGQVLAKLGTNDGGHPELRWYVESPGLGVCEYVFGFTDDEAGWAAAEAALARADAVAAKKAAETMWRASENMVPSI